MRYIVRQRTYNPNTYFEFETTNDNLARLIIELKLMYKSDFKGLDIKEFVVNNATDETICYIGEKGQTR